MIYISTYRPGENVPSSVILPDQVHGTRCVEIVSGDEAVSGCDALYTTGRKTALGVRTADCAPVCAWDDSRHGIAHVGWRGLAAGLPDRFLSFFSHPHVFVGPCLHRFVIQPDECMHRLSESVGDDFFTPDHEHGILFDFRTALFSTLPYGTVYDERCTATTPELASWRRDRSYARNITVISRRSLR